MKIKLLKDIVIPAGTVISNDSTPVKTEYFGELPAFLEFGIGKDATGSITIHHEAENVQDLYEVVDESVETTNGVIVSKKIGLSFGAAISAMEAGHRVAREGWNGKGMYLWLLPAAVVKAEWCREPHLKTMAEANGGEIEALGSIRMLTADRKVLTGWLASQTDMLAKDWLILE